MERKIWIGIGVLAAVLLILSLFIFLYRPAPTREQLLKKFEEFEGKSREMKEMGYNVTEAEKFAKQAHEFFEKKNYKRAEDLLNKAFEVLEEILIGIKKEAKERLSYVKVSCLYNRVTDGAPINRTLDDVIRILKETNTDFIYEGWVRYLPCPENCSMLSLRMREECEMRGYSYEHLRRAVSRIKEEMPDIIFCGGVLVEFLNHRCWNPITNEIFKRDETWNMALDPGKWGIDMSKEEFQTYYAKSQGWTEGKENYNPKEQMPFYFPDITNSEYQKLLMSWIKKQIDCGVDAIWIDMLFSQARILAKITGDEKHPAVQASYNASSKIIDEVHAYGYSKGKYIYVGTWWNFVKLPYPPPDVDFVAVSVSNEEILNKRINETRWNEIITEIRNKMPDVPIFVRFDYGYENSPLATFSQNLSKEEQREFLKIVDKFCEEKDLVFIYPIHGGGMGKNPRKLSYNKFNWYDSLAPEFQTYETIKELASNKTIVTKMEDRRGKWK